MDSIQIFEYNFSKAKNLLELTKIHEIKNKIDEFIEKRPRPLGLEPPLFGLFDSIREYLKTPLDNYMNIVSKTCYEQSVVAGVTALETYLRDKFCEEKGIDEYVGRSFQNVNFIEEKFREIDIEIFESEEVKRRLNHVLQIRHVIVHKAGIIDEKACNNAGWDNKLVGKHISRFLNYDIVKEILDFIERFVKDLETKSIKGGIF